MTAWTPTDWNAERSCQFASCHCNKSFGPSKQAIPVTYICNRQSISCAIHFATYRWNMVPRGSLRIMFWHTPLPSTDLKLIAWALMLTSLCQCFPPSSWCQLLLLLGLESLKHLCNHCKYLWIFFTLFRICVCVFSCSSIFTSEVEDNWTIFPWMQLFYLWFIQSWEYGQKLSSFAAGKSKLQTSKVVNRRKVCA